MFKRSEIGKKCNCGVPETVTREDEWRRFLVPAGSYAGFYLEAGYYLAVWWSLECNQCGNKRDDFFVYKWHRDGSGSMVDGLSPNRIKRYPEIYKAILAQMPE